MKGDPIYQAPAPLLDEQYEELAYALGIDPDGDRLVTPASAEGGAS